MCKSNDLESLLGHLSCCYSSSKAWAADFSVKSSSHRVPPPFCLVISRSKGRSDMVVVFDWNAPPFSHLLRLLIIVETLLHSFFFNLCGPVDGTM